MMWETSKSKLQRYAGMRVIEISDGTLTYFAPLGRRQAKTVAREFVATYDYNRADTEMAEDRGITREQALDELESELRATMRVVVHEDFDPERW
jgi:hypothetical protein